MGKPNSCTCIAMHLLKLRIKHLHPARKGSICRGGKSSCTVGICMWMGTGVVSECGFHSKCKKGQTTKSTKCKKREIVKHGQNRCILKANEPKVLPTIQRLVHSTNRPLKAHSRFLPPNEFPSWIPKDSGWRVELRCYHGGLAARINKYYWPPNAKWGLTSRSSVL